MPLIDPTPPVIDPLTAGVDRISQQSTAIYRQLSGLLKGASQFVWNNSAYTPQQVLAAFGPSGAQLFQLSSLAAQIVQNVTGTTVQVIPDGWTFQIATDGTVTAIGPSSSSSSSSSSAS